MKNGQHPVVQVVSIMCLLIRYDRPAVRSSDIKISYLLQSMISTSSIPMQSPAVFLEKQTSYIAH